MGFVYRAKQQRLNRQKQLMHEKRLALFKQRRTSKSYILHIINTHIIKHVPCVLSAMWCILFN